MTLSPREELQLRAIEAQLMAEAPDLDRILRVHQTRRRKLACWSVTAIGLTLMPLGVLSPVFITIGFVLSSAALLILVGPCLLGPAPPLVPRP